MVHETAEKGFQTAFEAYERGRPEYPMEAVELLVHELQIFDGRVIVDLGAGTGKFTRFLQLSDIKLIAIEPVDGMRHKFADLFPSIPILMGTAESMPLENQSVDGLICAQAFHWFDGPAALAEIHRVLKPGGKLGLIWNAKDTSAKWLAELDAIAAPYEKDTPQYSTGKWRSAFEGTKLFTPLQTRQFQHIQNAKPEMIVDRIASVSYIAALPDTQRNQVLEKVRTLLKIHPETKDQTEIPCPYITDVFWCEKVE